MTINTLPPKELTNIPGSFLENTFPSEKTANLYASSISQALEEKNSELAGLFGPPVLTMIHLMESTYEIGLSILHMAGEEIKQLSEDLKKKLTESIVILKKSATRMQDLSAWSLLQQASSSVLASFNLIMGGAVYSSAPAVGTTLIAAGLLSAFNLAITEMREWDKIAEKFAGNNKELKEQIAFWSPIALHCLSGALSAAGGSYLWYDPSLQPSVFPIKECIDSFSGVTKAGAGISQSRLSWTKADLTLIQTAIATDKMTQEVLAALIQTFMQMLDRIRKQVEAVVQLNSQLRI